MKLKIKAVIWWLVAISLMIGIFCFSAQTADTSSQTSRGFTHQLFSFMPWFNALSEPEQVRVVEDVQFFVRKIAHFSVYAFLGAALYQAFKYTFNKRKMYIFGALAAILYAISDEIHQGFVSGRSCEVRDMALDSLGAVTGILIVMLIKNAVAVKSRKNGEF